MYGTEGLICPIMDARRGQVYTGIYRFDTDGALQIVEDQMAVSIEELAEKLRGYGEKSYVPWRRRSGIQRTNHRRTACRSVGFFSHRHI